jgi:hypothetical protein
MHALVGCNIPREDVVISVAVHVDHGDRQIGAVVNP